MPEDEGRQRPSVIGLRNHRITATGASLEEILDRVAPRLLAQVPMS